VAEAWEKEVRGGVQGGKAGLRECRGEGLDGHEEPLTHPLGVPAFVPATEVRVL
jgi:hypothetical protein